MHPADILRIRTRGAERLDGRGRHTFIEPPMTRYVTHRPGTSALVFDSPHSGTWYPQDFDYACDFAKLRTAEDTHVEKLYDFASGLGVHWVEAHFPRSYLDANRATNEIDPAMIDGAWPDPLATEPGASNKVRLGKGLIWRTTDDGLAIYRRLLSVEEVQSRIARCWMPYHTAVGEAIGAAHRRHGFSIHINCHSMPAIAASHATNFPGEAHADFVVGDRDGSTANPALSKLVCHHLAALGYSVAYNHPYKGVDLVRRYSDPAAHRHSIQLEINRKLYMNEASLELLGSHETLRASLRSLTDLLLATDPRHL